MVFTKRIYRTAPIHVLALSQGSPYGPATGVLASGAHDRQNDWYG